MAKLSLFLQDARKKADTRGPSFVRLTRLIYQELNSVPAHILSPFVRHLLLNLFVNIGDATMLFLAGIWSFNESSPIEETTATQHGISVAALHHARAFVTAQQHSSESKEDSGTLRRDFQIIFPAVLIALQSSDRPTREAAVALLNAMAVTSSGTKVEIYAFDIAYQQSCKFAYGPTRDPV